MSPSVTLRLSLVVLVAGLLVASPAPAKQKIGKKKTYTVDLGTSGCTFSDLGRNRYFVLEPGHQLNLAGEIRAGLFEVRQTVTNQTRVINGVNTRLVEELERVNGEVVELSLNYYALCQETGDLFYFGEQVELLDGGVVVSSEGSWEAGVDGALPGIAMPATFMLGARYQMEIAPGIAMDRVENLDAGFSFPTPAGTFDNCVRTLESTPLEPGERTVKVYAEGIGAVADDVLRLVSWTPSDLAVDGD